MQELTEANLSEFAARYLFADGLIRFVCVAYVCESAVGDVVVSAREGLSGLWVNIHFRVEGLESFTVKQPLNTTSQVLFDGISVRWLGDLCYLDLSHDCNGHTTPSDYEQADFLLVGKKCFWSVAPYSDAVPGI